MKQSPPTRQHWSFFPKGLPEDSSEPAYAVIGARVDLIRTLSYEDQYGNRESERWRVAGTDRCLTWNEIQKMIDSTRGKAVLRLSNYQPSKY